MIFEVITTSRKPERFAKTFQRYGAKPSERVNGAMDVEIGNLEALKAFIHGLDQEHAFIHYGSGVIINSEGQMEIYDDYRE